MVRTTATLTRLLDVIALVTADRRVQVVFTVDDRNGAMLATGMRSVLDSLDALVVPWADAVDGAFDLVLAASENDDLGDLAAPVIVLPHGAGHLKFYPGTTTISGLTPDRVRDLTTSTTFALSHPDQLQRLAAVHPPAADKARVVGDPALGRMLASSHRAHSYRRGLDATGRQLVVLASTWGPDSLLGSWPDLPERLLAELPVDQYRVVAVLHPGIWAHGSWQVRAWWSRATEYGLRILPPEDGWQAALLGASCVLTDFGSLGLYAAALDRPVLLSPRSSPSTVPGSPAEVLAGLAPRLDPASGLRDQIDATIRTHVSGRFEQLSASAVQEPWRTAERLRSLLYERMSLAEPAHAAEFPPVPVPAVRHSGPTAIRASATATDELVTLVRYPSIAGADVPESLGHRHLVVELDRARLDQAGAADVLIVHADERAEAAALLRRWPHATMVAARIGPGTCWIHTRESAVVLHGHSGIDTTALASWAYVRIPRIPAQDRLRLGDRVMDVRAEAC
ncbi:hypothetical protein J3R03_007146 [Actinoplanes couchii]|uniref:CDP-Glycerol:Poly(Glycerophosphate) glycerophosphotransferase n=1 Tax=Actinoplanes couchii TaxID=403638 RepID=A0ABQ3X461_9ACTN|nr:hypothetical protein [Actinoplanes couchii]MDR6322950.1 hypothetical protein [Actinoplanes couchii]GID53190.1 hypothetical protein Aco03nite_015940 [Actinoplanes couchii]